MKFLHNVANCWINGKAVAAYTDGTSVRLVAETVGGRHVPFTRVVTLSPSEYEALREQWTDGCVSMDDARIQMRALEHLSVAHEA